jgi:hypothetical protein
MAVVGLLVAGAVLWWLKSAATFGPNGAAGALPAEWWVLFGGIAVLLGCGAALVTGAVFRRH